MVEATKNTITASSEPNVRSAEVVDEVNQIIKLLEAKLPANLDAPANQKLERQMQRSMSSYFGDLEKAFPYGKLEKLYNKNV